MTEAALLRALLLESSVRGMRLFRNQVGRYALADGRWLTSGLCVGSSDLIGFTPVTITDAMVGKIVSVFTAVEAKVGKNRPTTAQEHFLEVVQAYGGKAVVARCVADLDLLK